MVGQLDAAHDSSRGWSWNSPIHAFMVALVGFFAWIPMLLLGLVGGLLVDSVNRAMAGPCDPRRQCYRRPLPSPPADGNRRGPGLARVRRDPGHRPRQYAIDQPARRALVHDFLGSSGVTSGLALEAVAFSTSKIDWPGRRRRRS